MNTGAKPADLIKLAWACLVTGLFLLIFAARVFFELASGGWKEGGAVVAIGTGMLLSSAGQFVSGYFLLRGTTPAALRFSSNAQWLGLLIGLAWSLAALAPLVGKDPGLPVESPFGPATQAFLGCAGLLACAFCLISLSHSKRAHIRASFGMPDF